MLEVLTSLTNWEVPFVAKDTKKEEKTKPQSCDEKFKQAYHENTPKVEDEKIERTMLMVGDLTKALEKPRIQKMDDATLQTVSLSDDDSAALREQIDALQREKRQLQRRCKTLESSVDESRKESDLWKLKMTLAMGNLKSTIASLEEDKSCLTDKCRTLESKLTTARMENAAKQSQIYVLESDLTKLAKEKAMAAAQPVEEKDETLMKSDESTKSVKSLKKSPTRTIKKAAAQATTKP